MLIAILFDKFKASTEVTGFSLFEPKKIQSINMQLLFPYVFK